MTGWGTRLIAVLAVVACAIVVLAGCGSSDDSDTSSSSSTALSGSNETPSASGTDGTGDGDTAKGTKDSGNESSQSGGDSDSDRSSASVDPAPLKVSGGGSDQFRVAGGDNSVQEFGEESDESELEEAAGALHAFLVARAEEKWTAACSYMAKSVKDQLERITSGGDQSQERGCAGILGTLTPPLPAAVRNETTIVDAGSLRFEDGRAFLIYTGAEETTYAVLMEEEDGAWKVASLSAVPLS